MHQLAGVHVVGAQRLLVRRRDAGAGAGKLARDAAALGVLKMQQVAGQLPERILGALAVGLRQEAISY